VNTRTVRRFDGRLDAVVQVPGSKSIANRALVCAALADGVTELDHVPDGDDTTVMLDALRRLGAEVTLDGARVGVGGMRADWPAVTVHAGLAGTTSRFLTGLAALGTHAVTIDGHGPLRRRPFEPLLDALDALGASVQADETAGHLPVTVSGPPTGSRVEIRGDISSQYVSALMMIGPYLPDGLVIELTSPLVSLPYVELTAAVMGAFGVTDVSVADSRIDVAPGRYAATRLTIEPDASSASYPLALAAVVGGRVTIPGLGLGAVQGDARCADLLAAMGCGTTRTSDRVTVESGARLRGIDVDMADVSDLVPTLAAVAAVAESPTRIRGVGFIRAKESDRLGDLAAELRALGVDLDETDDGLDIRPSSHRLVGGRVGTHHDHRLAMAFGVLGARCGGVVVDDPEVVSKSWPAFWDVLDGLGG
jgi:3-phosphoshikimate 1-carboxyvinyltransferase